MDVKGRQVLLYLFLEYGPFALILGCVAAAVCYLLVVA